MLSLLRYLMLACLGLLLALVYRATDPPPLYPVAHFKGRPRLAVLVVIDQLRGDYLERWHDQFGDGGFRRLEREGAWYANCHYPYAYTFTGPGHASVAAGCCPDVHGIINNGWYEGIDVSCVGSDRHSDIGLARGGWADGGGSASPERLLAPTIGDSLKEATGNRGRVVSLSFKDRSAVLPGGQKADACYWMHKSTGEFVTSSYYRLRPHAWVREFNQADVADRWFGQAWEPLPGSQPPGSPGFAHLLHAYNYSALFGSPFGNDLLLELAKKAVSAEGLGKGPYPDLLCISFSSNDAVGHVWGPDSLEVRDITIRTDRVIQALLEHLDREVGRDQYILALTADHGVCPLPEDRQDMGLDAGRVDDTALAAQAEAFLKKAYGTDMQWIAHGRYPWIYLNANAVRERGLDHEEVAEKLAGWLRQQPEVMQAWTRRQQQAGFPAEDRVARMVARCCHPRTGDVAFVLKPYYIPPPPTGCIATHGSPHPYDTHVPLLVFGPGVKPGKRMTAASPLSVAPILAKSLGIQPPAKAEAAVPDDLWQEGVKK